MTFIIEYKSSEKNDNIWRRVCDIECDSSVAKDELKSPNIDYGEGYIFKASHSSTGTTIGMSCVVDGVPIILPDLSDAGLLMDGVEGAYAHNIYNWQADVKNHAYRFGGDWERAWFLCDDPAWLFCLAMHIPVKSMKIAAALAMLEEMKIATQDLYGDPEGTYDDQIMLDMYTDFIDFVNGRKSKEKAITKLSEMYGLGRLADACGQFECAKTICDMFSITLQYQQYDKEFLRLISNKIREIIDFPEIIYCAAKYHCKLRSLRKQ